MRNRTIACQTDDVVEEIKDNFCPCDNCCFSNRQNDPAYIAELDDEFDECICQEALQDTANYYFLIPFVLSLSLGVMQFGSFYVETTDEMKQIGYLQNWKGRMLATKKAA